MQQRASRAIQSGTIPKAPMSLRAKLEAVIYAAEEPVTLAQLAALFSEEALQWKAEQEAVFRAMQAQAAAESGQVLTIGEGLTYSGTEQTAEFHDTAEDTAEAAQADPGQDTAPASDAVLNVGVDGAFPPVFMSAVEPATVSQPAFQTSLEVAPDVVPEAPGVLMPVEPPDTESEAKRTARVRDRDVKAILRQILDELIASYAADQRGIEIREIAGGFRMATKPECHDAVRIFIRSQKPPLKLSLPALETLAVIAYKQPVTAPEVSEIRGVESGGVLGSLLGRKLISTAGRKQVIGRPILYKTTKEFLLRFGLKDISELPSMEEFEKMATIELSETPDAEAESAGGLAPGSGPEFDENATEDEAAAEIQPVAAAETNAPEPEAASAESAAETTTTQAEAADAENAAEITAPEPEETIAESATETEAPEVEVSHAADTPEAAAQAGAAHSETTADASAPEPEGESAESTVEITTVESEAAGVDDSSTESDASKQRVETEPVTHD